MVGAVANLRQHQPFGAVFRHTVLLGGKRGAGCGLCHAGTQIYPQPHFSGGVHSFVRRVPHCTEDRSTVAPCLESRSRLPWPTARGPSPKRTISDSRHPGSAASPSPARSTVFARPQRPKHHLNWPTRTSHDPAQGNSSSVPPPHNCGACPCLAACMGPTDLSRLESRTPATNHVAAASTHVSSAATSSALHHVLVSQLLQYVSRCSP